MRFAHYCCELMFSFAPTRSAAEAPEARRQPLPYPVSPCPPIAILSPYFMAATPALALSHPDELTLSGARTVAAPLSVLRSIAASTMWRPEYPLVVLSGLNGGLLGEADRDYLWETFEVPVFEYLLSESGKLLAQECEAHEGLHVHPGVEGLGGMLTRDVCPCGKATPRLLALDAIIEESSAVSSLKQEWRNWQTHQT